ncbi:MAG TPA: ABC transporter permease, partial [Bryobacteraceae bacterium]|nr:ABC transporter permease [Bryobacteraceae bacterium]
MFTRFFNRAKWDRERARELEGYVEVETQENIARGMSPDEARSAAHRKLGNPTLIREEIYRMNTIAFLDSVWQDLRYGMRTLRLNPGFALVAIASLALGIGANTAIFQLIDAVNLRTLPVARAQELAEVRITDLSQARGSMNRYPALTNPQWEHIRNLREPFSGIFAWATDDLNLASSGETRLGRALWVSGEAFDTLGVRPLVGRLFTAADDRRGCGLPGVVISYGFWKSEFGGDPGVIGRTVHVDPFNVPVIGVTPPEFFGLEVGKNFDMALPICSEAALGDVRRMPNGKTSSRLDSGTSWWLVVMGRLKPGWTHERASVYFASQSKALFEATLPAGYPPVSIPSYLAFKLEATPAGTGLSGLRENYSDPLKMLLVIAGLVLLVACANLANLMLARSSARGREMAVRLAIGASRGRLIRQFLSESLLISVAGAALGPWLATGLTQVLVALLSTRG